MKYAHSQPSIKFLRSVPGSSASFADGCPPLQGYSERLDSGNFSTRRQQKGYKSVRRCSQGSALVDSRPCTSNWQGNYSSKSRFSNLSGCFKDRIGSSSSRIQHRRSLERARSPRPCKLLGPGSSISGFQSFLPLIKGSHVQFRLENHTAVAYINQLGGTRSQHPTALAIDIWCYVLDRNMLISAIHVPAKWNPIADKKSRIFHDSIEWMLDRSLLNR